MPTGPTTRSQVQAYRFVLRRMESALVRRDAAMVHEPMRNHLRASVVGAILGVLGLAAFFVIGLVNPAGRMPGDGIVVVRQTGQVFLVVPGSDPPRLMSVPNVTSARLLYAALFSPHGGEPPRNAEVEASAVAGLSRVPTTGLEGFPEIPPGPENLVGGDWSVCDTTEVRDASQDPRARPALSTTVVVGVGRPGLALRDDEALLVESELSGATYLVHSGRRLPVDLTDEAVTLAYQLDAVVPRKVSAGLLNAIPEGNPLTRPDVPAGAGPTAWRLGGVRVGDVVRVDRAAGPPSYFLMLPDGKQEVDSAVADLIGFAAGSIRDVQREDIAAVPDAAEAGRVDFAGFPARVPEVVGVTETPTACAVWQDPAGKPVITVHEDERLPLGATRQAVALPGYGAGSDFLVPGSVDRFFLEPGKGALVRTVLPGQAPNTGGEISLVTDEGVKYNLPSIEVARALGLGQTPAPAPPAVLELLPRGWELNPWDAVHRVDPELAERLAEQGGR